MSNNIDLKLIKSGSQVVNGDLLLKAKIQAANSSDAIAYFKGRFNTVGELVKTNTKTIFTIRQIN